MRRTLTALLIVLLLVPDLPARTNHGWENVKKVKPGTPIQILLWTGDDVRGELDEVSDTGLRLYTADRTAPQTTRERDVDRKNIRRSRSRSRGHPGRKARQQRPLDTRRSSRRTPRLLRQLRSPSSSRHRKTSPRPASRQGNLRSQGTSPATINLSASQVRERL
jgi:hypothetical protein